MADETFFDTHNPRVAERIAVGLHKVSLALRHGAQAAVQGRGLTPLQDQILALLHRHESEAGRGSGLRPGQLANALAVKAPTVSDALSALAEKDLTVRTSAPDDARASVIALTTKGRKEAARSVAWPDFLVTAVDAMGPDEQTTFLHGVVKMVGALQDAGRIPVARMCTSCDFFRAHVHRAPSRPHHCAFVDAPLGPADFRLDCTEHVPADPVRQAQNDRLIQTGG